MGADLYIDSIYQPHHKLYEEEMNDAGKVLNHARESFLWLEIDEMEEFIRVASIHYDEVWAKAHAKGYYRDSYNPWCLLSCLGLSWSVDVRSLCTYLGYLPVYGAEKFRVLLEARPVPPPEELQESDALMEMISEERCQRRAHMFGDPGPSSVSELYDYFTNKREKLLEFLQVAIDLDESIRCWL